MLFEEDITNLIVDDTYQAEEIIDGEDIPSELAPPVAAPTKKVVRNKGNLCGFEE